MKQTKRVVLPSKLDGCVVDSVAVTSLLRYSSTPVSGQDCAVVTEGFVIFTSNAGWLHDCCEGLNSASEISILCLVHAFELSLDDVCL